MSRDIRGVDLVIAITVAMTVVLAAGVALSAPALNKGEAPDIDVGLGIPISVTPVLDAPAGSRRGGGKTKAREVPKSWQRRAPPKPPPQQLPPPPPQDTTRAPPPDPATPEVPPPTKQPNTPKPPDAPDPLPDVVDDDAPPEPETAPPPEPTPPEPAGDGDGDGGDGPPGPPDPDGEEEGGGGDGDDLVGRRAIASYRERLIRWLSARFRVTGSGMSTAELLKYKVRATIQIGDDRTVTRFSLKPSGSAVFDRAAKEALESVVGEQVPPPPDDYPGALQSTVKMTFVCKESTCN